MSDRFADEVLPLTLRYEGGYVNDPDDPGGATNKGVTQKVYDGWLASRGSPKQSVQFITDSEVAAIYRHQYWEASGADKLTPPLDLLHFDAAVNHGPAQAKKFLIVANGKPEAYLVAREMFYRRLVERKPVMGKFLKGWLRRVDDLRGRI